MGNSRFKFRAYDKELRKMYEVDTICPYEDNHTKGGEVFLKGIQHNSFYFPEEVEVMQCTGLEDKNGKLIYEGDMLKTKEHNLCKEGELFKVFYQETLCQFLGKSLTTNNCIDLCDLYEDEVIGNIYENKELLDE